MQESLHAIITRGYRLRATKLVKSAILLLLLQLQLPCLSLKLAIAQAPSPPAVQ